MESAGRWLRRIALGGATILGLLAAAVLLTARAADPTLFPPSDGAPRVAILVVDHGYHVGLVVPREALGRTAGTLGLSALIAVDQRFAAYEWLELGWGEETFYRHAPGIGDVTLAMAVRSLFGPGNASVLHVVGFDGDPRRVFRGGRIVGLHLSEPGFARTMRGLDGSFARVDSGRPVEIGPGLYGPSLFYRAVGAYHLLNVCNHWVGLRLSEAGVPSSWLPSTLSPTLIMELRWRAGAE